ncbi:uncharacterized protein BJ212DRAFT_1447584 [Suillus subaureus]|uniref:DDH domain-containing protein n=1 Tax=Suillus subaureus TaxID=48587 RepID=A0A9P7E8E8_9AGAM|nr:uncharacterized protein BJ212DRAFT_1447584 [Suillus subaureus]KAG1814281.1 hypothetical protein BJ212DRAFT_1447584 [Suillus subaureus]
MSSGADGSGRSDNAEGWTVVMGNEAGDLDSLASALGYAWLRSNTSGKVIAYITTPEDDFVLRAENLHALGLAGINYPFEELYCSSDLRVSQFALVDHNDLHTRYASPTARVVAVIDYHEDEGQYKDTTDPRIVEPAGSCSSLVARVYQLSPNLFIPAELSTLLLSAILIDTQGLKEGGKALDIDREAAAFLIPQSLLDTMNKSPHHQINNHQLPPPFQKKLSVSHLSTRDLLWRDYKEEGKAGATLDIKADEGIAEKLWQGLESSEELKLKRLDFSKFGANATEESEDEDAEEVTTDEARFGESYVTKAYKQGNASATRKQTAPILRRLMEGL